MARQRGETEEEHSCRLSEVFHFTMAGLSPVAAANEDCAGSQAEHTVSTRLIRGSTSTAVADRNPPPSIPAIEKLEGDMKQQFPAQVCNLPFAGT